jgi:molybdenum cofactor cytidylyltransferase
VKPAGVILAAGESSRMGSDKALLPFAGSTFLEHLIRLFAPRVAPLVVVLGHHAEAIRAAITRRPGLVFAVNPDYRRGQLSSLQTALRALPAEAPAALVTLVDHPAVAESTLDAVLGSFRPENPVLAIPRYRGKRGHPVLLPRRLLDELAALPPDASAKQVVHAHHAEALFLDLDDPGIVADVDTPAEYRQLVGGRN